MKKLIILLIVIVVHLISSAATRGDKKFLFISFFFMSIPFQFAIPVWKMDLASNSGTLGTAFSITLPILTALFFITNQKFRWVRIQKGWYTLVFVALLLIALINPNNASALSSLIYVMFVAVYLIIFNYIAHNFKVNDIVKGIYHAFTILCVFQLVLAICFPLLNLPFVTKLFFEAAEKWATRMGTRPGAVGVFTHPGNLALFTTMASVFFISCLLNGYKVKASKVYILICVLTVLLTYSRTSYLTMTFALFACFFIYKKAQTNIFSIKNIIGFGIPVTLLLCWIIFYSPISSIFLDTNADDMYTARLMHWFMALDVFSNHPVIGVGLNAHLEFFQKNVNLLKSIDSKNDFLISNPVHNIHLIVLAETGLLGFVFWLAVLIRSIFGNKKYLGKIKDLSAFKGQSILLIATIGATFTYLIYGMAGWAPFSEGLFPYFIFFVFYSFVITNKLKHQIAAKKRRPGNATYIEPKLNLNI